MNWFFLALSCLVLASVIFDFFYTAISNNGAGPIASRLSSAMSRLLLTLNKKYGQRKFLKYSGMSIILAFIIWWVGALWVGFLLLLLFDTSSVVNTASGVSASVVDKIYYSGYVLSTMGNGDFKPGNGIWQVIISLFSFSGFIFITTAITYLISVSSAVIHKRSLSLFINDLVSLNSKEDTMHCFLENATELRNMINRHNQNHLAYPVVHYFFSMDKKTSFSQCLWKLNHLLGEVQHEQQNQSHKVIPLFQAIDHYLDTVTQSFIPTPQKDEIEEKHEHRKSQLHDLLKSDGWNDQPQNDY